MRTLRVSGLAGIVFLALVSAAFAGGSNVYPNGAEGFWMGAAPPPGMYYVNYDLWYSSNKFTSNHGSEVKTGPMGPFDTDVFANVSRFIWISNQQVLGANWGAHVFVVYQDVDTKTALGHSRVNGLGDTIIDPFILAWHWPNFHVTTGVDIYVPTGLYHPGRVSNTSANAFVYEPVAAFTYMTPVKGLTTSAKFMYDIAEENKNARNPFMGPEGHLQYGQEFHFDYSVDYMVTPELKAGIGGYYYKQITDDEFNGVDIKNQKGQVFAIGPGVEYSKGRFIVSYRLEFEMLAKNRPEGIANWLRIVYAF
jgi:hypothetical protein